MTHGRVFKLRYRVKFKPYEVCGVGVTRQYVEVSIAATKEFGKDHSLLSYGGSGDYVRRVDVFA